MGRSERRHHYEAEKFESARNEVGRSRLEPGSFIEAANVSGRSSGRMWKESSRVYDKSVSTKAETNERKRKHWSDTASPSYERDKFNWQPYRSSQQLSTEKEKEYFVEPNKKKVIDWGSKELLRDDRKGVGSKREYSPFKEESYIKTSGWNEPEALKFHQIEKTWTIGQNLEPKEKYWSVGKQKQFESPPKDFSTSKLPLREEFRNPSFRPSENVAESSYPANFSRGEGGRPTKSFSKSSFSSKRFNNEKDISDFNENYPSDDELDYEDDEEEDKWETKVSRDYDRGSPFQGNASSSRLSHEEKIYDKVHYEQNSERFSKVSNECNLMKKDYRTPRSSPPFRHQSHKILRVNDSPTFEHKRMGSEVYQQGSKYVNESRHSFNESIPQASYTQSDYKSSYSRRSPVFGSKSKYSKGSSEEILPTYEVDKPSTSYLYEGNSRKDDFTISRRRSLSRSSNEATKKQSRYRVAVMSENCSKLTAEDVDNIIDCIKEMNARGKEYHEFEFIGRKSKNLIFIVDPLTLKGMKWLVNIKNFPGPYGKKYTSFPYDEIFESSYMVKTCVFNDLVPNGAASIKCGDIFKELEKANEGLCTDLWKTKKYNLETRGLFMLMTIDKMSMILLKGMNWRPKFMRRKLIIRPIENEKAHDK